MYVALLSLLLLLLLLSIQTGINIGLCAFMHAGCALINARISVYTYIHTYNIPYILVYKTSRTAPPPSPVLPEKFIFSQIIKKFHTLYGIWKLITAFKTACHLSLSLVSSIQATLAHFTSWRFILILLYHVRVFLSSGFLSSGLPTKIDAIYRVFHDFRA